MVAAEDNGGTLNVGPLRLTGAGAGSGADAGAPGGTFFSSAVGFKTSSIDLQSGGQVGGFAVGVVRVVRVVAF